MPVWYAGQKISPAFTNHIFWPSPQKKTKSNKVRELFPACASSRTWREVYRRKEEDKLKKGTPKCKDNSKEVKFKATGKKTKPVTSSVARQSKKTASSSIASSQSKEMASSLIDSSQSKEMASSLIDSSQSKETTSIDSSQSKGTASVDSSQSKETASSLIDSGQSKEMDSKKAATR